MLVAFNPVVYSVSGGPHYTQQTSLIWSLLYSSDDLRWSLLCSPKNLKWSQLWSPDEFEMAPLLCSPDEFEMVHTVLTTVQRGPSISLITRLVNTVGAI